MLKIERPTTKGNGKWQISIGSQPPDDWIEGGTKNFIHFCTIFFLSFFGTFFFIRFFHPDRRIRVFFLKDSRPLMSSGGLGFRVLTNVGVYMMSLGGLGF